MFKLARAIRDNTDIVQCLHTEILNRFILRSNENLLKFKSFITKRSKVIFFTVTMRYDYREMSNVIYLDITAQR